MKNVSELTIPITNATKDAVTEKPAEATPTVVQIQQLFYSFANETTVGFNLSDLLRRVEFLESRVNKSSTSILQDLEKDKSELQSLADVSSHLAGVKKSINLLQVGFEQLKSGKSSAI